MQPLRRHALRLSALVVLALACSDGADRDGIIEVPTYRVDLTPVVTGLAAPVYLTAPAGDPRLFVVERGGRVRVFEGGQLLATPFLDISSRVGTGGERGLLSIAFDPSFASNGHVFVHFTDVSGAIVVERWTAAGGADVASAATATPVITIPHPGYSNHNGGLVMFGPDGMLFLSTGDGGGSGDPDRNARDLGSLLGKLLRLDVRTLPYAIPAGNPFVGQAGRRGEIWAYGLRNPWRFDFADATATTPALLYVADVGQDEYEEIDIVRADSAGVDYGWSVAEGSHCYRPTTGCTMTGMHRPALEYGHSEGCSIIGGFVTRGVMAPGGSVYFYSDYCSGWVRSLAGGYGSTATPVQWTADPVGNVLGFGEGADGQQYLLSTAGTVYRIVPTSPHAATH
jgi:glucose/arabinose dehydrogenase